MPFFICPNCKERSVDLDGYDGFSTQAIQCRSCAFGFLYELLALARQTWIVPRAAER